MSKLYTAPKNWHLRAKNAHRIAVLVFTASSGKWLCAFQREHVLVLGTKKSNTKCTWNNQSSGFSEFFCTSGKVLPSFQNPAWSLRSGVQKLMKGCPMLSSETIWNIVKQQKYCRIANCLKITHALNLVCSRESTIFYATTAVKMIIMLRSLPIVACFTNGHGQLCQQTFPWKSSIDISLLLTQPSISAAFP